MLAVVVLDENIMLGAQGLQGTSVISHCTLCTHTSWSRKSIYLSSSVGINHDVFLMGLK